MIVAGADGCRAGWVVVLHDTATHDTMAAVHATFREAVAATSHAAAFGVDMPIGLLEVARAGGRACDVAARRLLGFPRCCSVFSPPVRPVLACASYRDALRVQRANSPSRTGFSIQAWHIGGRLREVDDLMSPALQERVIEVHPEVSFRALAGSAVIPAKKTPEGRRRRMALLRAAGFEGIGALPASVPRRLSGSDDVLDACAAAWSARRFAVGEAERAPAAEETDARGLRMEIWY